MKNTILFITTFILSTFSNFALGQHTLTNKENLLAEYENIFEVKKEVYEDKSYLSTQVLQLPDTHFLAGFVNQNQRMIGYLMNNYSSVGYQQSNWDYLQTLLDDSVKLQKIYFETLKNDENFNPLFLELLINP